MKYQNIWVGLVLIIVLIETAYVLAFKTQILLPFFDLNGEANLPTWVTSVLFALAGTTAIGNYVLKAPGKKFWLILGLCCLFVSLDEVAQIHENISNLTGIKWIYIYGPVGGAILILLTKYALNLSTKYPSMKLIMSGVALGFILSIGLESLSYFGLTSTWQKVEFMLEEGAEMLGAGMIFIGCLQELSRTTETTEQVS